MAIMIKGRILKKYYLIITFIWKTIIFKSKIIFLMHFAIGFNVIANDTLHSFVCFLRLLIFNLKLIINN